MFESEIAHGYFYDTAEERGVRDTDLANAISFCPEAYVDTCTAYIKEHYPEEYYATLKFD